MIIILCGFMYFKQNCRFPTSHLNLDIHRQSLYYFCWNLNKPQNKLGRELAGSPLTFSSANSICVSLVVHDQTTGAKKLLQLGKCPLCCHSHWSGQVILLSGGTLSSIIDDLAMPWPLHPALYTCRYAIGCGSHPVPTSLLLRRGRLGAY